MIWGHIHKASKKNLKISIADSSIFTHTTSMKLHTYEKHSFIEVNAYLKQMGLMHLKITDYDCHGKQFRP